MISKEKSEFNIYCFCKCYFCERCKRNNVSRAYNSLPELFFHVRSCPNHEFKKSNDRLRGFDVDLTKQDFLRLIRKAIDGDPDSIQKLDELGVANFCHNPVFKKTEEVSN